ncbi:uncharacterized protein [Epargyreus clarus]
METVPVPAQNSAGSNTNSVKSEDGNPPQGSGRASPPPNCAICLGTCRNKSFTDSCLHQFCFKCLLTWSKVKAVCPLCKQNFRSIIHNVRSNHQYEEYMVEQRTDMDLNEGIDIDALASRTFRYRTTLTLPRHETIAIRQLLLQHYPMMANVIPLPSRRRRSPSLFRRTVYRHNLWARPLPDFTGRYRDCSPAFYRYNDTQMHRLMPWLNRELVYLLNENEGHITYVMARILELLPHHHINSPEFRDAMRRYFGDRTEHFLHELYCFASTPYDMTGYDRNVQYTTDSTVSTIINEVLSSSESDASVDSDIVMITSSAPAEPPAGPSRVPAPVYPQNYIPDPAANNVIPIETISHSDTDDDDEVMVVGYIKPPQDRTPEIVDLLGSDSDVIVQEPPPPEPAHGAEAAESRAVPLVKLSLKCHRAGGGASDSDSDSSYAPPRPRRRRRARSAAAPASASSSSPSSSSSSASSSSSSSTSPSPSPSRAAPSAGSRDSSLSTGAADRTSSGSDTVTDYRVFAEERKRVSKRKSKRKGSSERSKKRSKRSASHSRRKDDKASTSNSDKSSKRKSDSGKGVKSSRKTNDATSSLRPPALDQLHTTFDQPTASTSGLSSFIKQTSNSDQHHKACRRSHESRRLKSVVRVIKSKKPSDALYSNENANILCNTVQSASTSRAFQVGERTRQPSETASHTPPLDSTDSEDDLPLNLTIQKISQ